MKSVADRLRNEERVRLLTLTADERVTLALALGRRDLEAFRASHAGRLTESDAARALECQRHAGRRRSRCVEAAAACPVSAT